MDTPLDKLLRDEYKNITELGSGGMALVYRAVQKSLDRPVAIKQLKAAYQNDASIAQRFEREARMAASFHHENIVHIYDYWKKPQYCIVMEFVDGVTLGDILEKSGPLPPDVGVMIAVQVAHALEYAHARGLIHRDIKPGNVMIRRNGEVKLMDFGIARVTSDNSLTLPGTVLGTPSYMSPEQVLAQTVDARSDIFSFGIVLYEMFTGRTPFEDEKTDSISAKILKGAFTAPRRLNPAIPRALQRIIKKCLRKKPHRRYETSDDLVRALVKRIRGVDKPALLRRVSDYLVQKGLVEPPSEDDTVKIFRSRRMSRLAKAAIAAAVAALLLAGVAGYYLWQQDAARGLVQQQQR